MRRRLLAAAALVLPAAAADARTVDYAVPDAQFEADAKALGMAALDPAPQRGQRDVVVENAGALDHRLTILGISCSAWTVDNPLSRMTTRLLAAWDRDGAIDGGAAPAAVRLRFTSGGSTMRCVQQAEMKMRCIVRTMIAGEAIVPGAEQRVPIAVDVSHQQDLRGACGGLARGAALSGRAATIALIGQLAALPGA